MEGAIKGADWGYPYSLHISYENWGAKELLGVSQPSNSESTIGRDKSDPPPSFSILF